MQSSLRRRISSALIAGLALTAPASAVPVTLISENHQWDFLHPMGTLASPGFDTTWYLASAAFQASYTGPSFSTASTGLPADLASFDAGPGAGPFAYGGIDGIATVGTTLTLPDTANRHTAYFRKNFTVPAGGLIEPEFSMICDDGSFIYLDGNLIAKVNIADGVVDTYTSFAADATTTETLFTFHLRSTGLQPGGTPDDVNVLVPLPSLTAGEHTLAVSVHQNANTSSDLGFSLKLAALTPDTCTLRAAVTNVVRDFRGTPLVTTDDEFSFQVTVSGSNGGAGWQSDATPVSGSYGVATTFGPFPAGSPAVVNFTASADPACTTMVTVNAPPATKTLVNYNHVWKIMNPLAGALPPRPLGGADTNFESTWYLRESEFLTAYDGPNFGADGVAGSYQALTGPGPFAVGGVDGIVAGQPVGAAGTTTVTLPASGSRLTSYYRTTFTNTEPMSLLVFDLLCDDGVFIYLDGELVAQENMSPATPGFAKLAVGARTETLITTINMSAAQGGNVLKMVDGIAPGTHTLAVSLHQSSNTSSDLGVALKLSGIERTGECIISAATSDLIRSEAGTPGVPGDDTFSFKVTVSGTNAGATWQSDSTPATGAFGALTSMGPFPVSGGAKVVNFSASSDPACMAPISVSPPGCTMAAVASAATRSDNGTPTDPRDDTFIFSVTPTGTFLSASWTNTVAPLSGPYGAPTVFGPFPTTGSATVTLRDSFDTLCTASVTVVPPRYIPVAELVPYSHVWQVMNPLIATVPDDNAGDFATTWFLPEPSFQAQYTGPHFGSNGVAASYEAITGPGPFAAGGVDGLAPGTTIGPAGTAFTLPASASRYSSYYRTTFTTTATMDNLKFDILCDDGVFIYLDGVLVAQENIAAADTHQALATAARGETLISTIALTDPPGANVVVTVPVLTAGTHTLAVSLHQSAADSSDAGLAITLYGRPGNGCLITPVTGTVTRNLNNTADPADDTFTFPMTVNAVNSGPGWNSNSLPASGSYGTTPVFGPFPIIQAPKTMTFTDSADPLCLTNLIVNVPAVFGTKTTSGTVSGVRPLLPIPANWRATGSSMSHSTNISVADPGSQLMSEVVDLASVSGPVYFTMDLILDDNSNASNFEAADTVLVELVLNDGASDQRVNLITGFDTNGDLVLNGFTGADAAAYNADKAQDELNGAGLDAEASAHYVFALSSVIPDNIVSAQVVVTVVAVGGTETVTVTNVRFGPVPANLDSDGDGQTDAAEAIAGTDPNDRTDYLHILGITRTGNAASISFPSKPGKNYRAEVSNRVASGWTSFGPVIPGTGADITTSLPQAPLPGEPKYFLRIKVVP